MRFLSHLKILIVGLILGGLGVWIFNSYYLSKHVTSLGELFQENVEYNFYSYATKITGKQRLQVAKLQQVEVFERTSKLKAFWIDLPDVVVKATVPVEYSFFVEMNQGWKFRLFNDEIIIDVPQLSNNTPAVDIGKLHFDVVKGSLFRNEKESLEKIQKDLMGLLVEKSIEHRTLVREQARASIEQFVGGWLSQVTGNTPSQKVHVRFPDETDLEKSLQ